MTYRAKPITQRDGSSLANSNCRMASGATGIDYDTLGKQTSTGAKMRTYTSDQSGGTSSSDLDEAWHRGYDNNVAVGDGGSFDDALDALREGRLVHLDVWHKTAGGPCLSGSGAYGHTMAVAPERDGSRWLVADPWCSPAKWVWWEESKLRAGAEEWGRQVFTATAGEPDWPDASPAERLVILTRVVRRLMTRAHPGREHPEDETGGSPGGPIMFTYTAKQATGGGDMAYKVTIDGRVGRIDIIPNPANAYLRLDTGQAVGDYTFTEKEPAMPGTIVPDFGGRSDGYLVGGTLAWIPGHNATFTERAADAAGQWDADAEALLGPRPSA